MSSQSQPGCAEVEPQLQASEPSACKTPGTRYSTAMPTATSIQVTLRFPFVISDWALGNSAVTEGSRLERYEQMFAERKRVDDLIHDQMEVVGADAYRVMGFTLAASEWNAELEGRPFTAKDWNRLTLGEQTDYLLRTRALDASTASPTGVSVEVPGTQNTPSPANPS